MDILTLASTAYILSKPFLEKTGEGVARKVGEDIWNLIKSPFVKKGKDDIEALAISDKEAFTKELQQQLQDDPELTKQLTELVNNSQNLLSGNFQQNINSYGEVAKQVNVQIVNGGITL